MGALKQLLAFKGSTLISNVIAQARQARFDRIVVVVGSHGEAVSRAIEQEPVEIAMNHEWSSGMGSSIRAGMKHFHKAPPMPDRIAILLSDQPLVQAHHIDALLDLQASTGAPLVAAEYAGHAGVPAVFGQTMFSFLESLALDTGAKHLLRAGKFDVVTYPLPEAATDLDTPADLAALEGTHS
jgi:molybdenum cofactor cytidylyltransferase